MGGWTGNCSFHFSTRLKGGIASVGVGRIHLPSQPQSILWKLSLFFSCPALSPFCQQNFSAKYYLYTAAARMWKFNPIALERRERVTADNLFILGSSRKWPAGRQKSWFIATNADLQEKKGAANIFSWHLGEKNTSLGEKANDEWGRCIYLGINILQRRAEMCRELQEKLFNKSVLTFLSLQSLKIE